MINKTVIYKDWIAHIQTDMSDGGEVRIVGPAEFNNFIDGIDLIYEDGQAKSLALFLIETGYALLKGKA